MGDTNNLAPIPTPKSRQRNSRNRRRCTKWHVEPLLTKMKKAIVSIRINGRTYEETSAKYGVPRRTLRRYVNMSNESDSIFYMGNVNAWCNRNYLRKNRTSRDGLAAESHLPQVRCHDNQDALKDFSARRCKIGFLESIKTPSTLPKLTCAHSSGLNHSSRKHGNSVSPQNLVKFYPIPFVSNRKRRSSCMDTISRQKSNQLEMNEFDIDLHPLSPLGFSFDVEPFDFSMIPP